jgi:hypothetical protein
MVDVDRLAQQLVDARILARGDNLEPVSASAYTCYQHADQILQRQLVAPVRPGVHSEPSPLVRTLLSCNTAAEPAAPSGDTLPLSTVLAACLVLRSIPAAEAVRIVDGVRTQYPCTEDARSCLRLPEAMQAWLRSLDDESQCLLAAFLVWEANHVSTWNPALALYQQGQGGASQVDLQHPKRSWSARHWWIWLIVAVVVFIIIAAVCIRYSKRHVEKYGRVDPLPHYRSRLYGRRYPYSGRRLGRSTLLPPNRSGAAGGRA